MGLNGLVNSIAYATFASLLADAEAIPAEPLPWPYRSGGVHAARPRKRSWSAQSRPRSLTMRSGPVDLGLPSARRPASWSQGYAQEDESVGACRNEIAH